MYIDPNTGGVLFQALAAIFGIVVTALFAFSGKIRAAIASLRRKMRKDNDEDNA